MAQKVGKIGGNDVLEKFIITNQYGVPGDWPHGKGSTIVLSTVEIYYSTYFTKSIEPCKTSQVYKNGGYQEHAERYFLDELAGRIKTLKEANHVKKVNKIQAKLVQNYSPCNNYRTVVVAGKSVVSGCADDILQFKEYMEQQGITFSLTIKFGTFYYHQKPPNKEGLKKLLRNGVKLELLQGKADWEAFLNDENFVELTDDEYTMLLERATSEERTNRETKDVEILDKITAEPAKGRQEAIKQLPCEQSPLVFLLGKARRSERDSAELVYTFI
jgi:hypothetical protein